MLILRVQAHSEKQAYFLACCGTLALKKGAPGIYDMLRSTLTPEENAQFWREAARAQRERSEGTSEGTSEATP
jgi:hypothetical protein